MPKTIVSPRRRSPFRSLWRFARTVGVIVLLVAVAGMVAGLVWALVTYVPILLTLSIVVALVAIRRTIARHG